jgi:hypothetical protein
MGVRVGNITIDCNDVMTVAEFWSAAMERPLDEGASEWYATIGGSDLDRVQPAWYFSRVPEGKTSKNRMHVDVFDPSPDIVDRLVSLGAVVVEEHELSWANHRWTVMQDPEGNEFCVGTEPFGGT